MPYRFSSALVIPMLLVASLALAETAPERALLLHDEAKTLYAKGKYNDAIEKLRMAIELDPEAKVLYYNLGLIEEKLGHVDTALAYFRRCLELEQSHAEKVGLAKTIKRLEGARTYVDWTNNSQTPPIIIRKTSGQGASPSPHAVSALLPWTYVAGGTSLVAAAIGIGLAVRAGDVDPGKTPTTAPGVTMEALQDRSSKAHSLAIGADVSFGIAAVALGTTVVLAIVSANGVGTPEAPDRHAFALGPLGGQWSYRF